jgi:hypothetical protein
VSERDAYGVFAFSTCSSGTCIASSLGRASATARPALFQRHSELYIQMTSSRRCSQSVLAALPRYDEIGIRTPHWIA